MSLRNRLAVFMGRNLDRLYGRDSQRYLPRLEAMEAWPAARLLAHQDERLGALLRHAWKHVPWYRRRMEAAGLGAGDLADDRGARAALARLPPLSREELRRSVEALRALPASQLYRSATSGSSGQPVTVYHDKPLAGWGRAVQRRAFRWYGVDLYEPRLMLLAAPLTWGKRLRHRLVDLLTWRRLSTFYDLTDSRLEAVVGALRRFRPSYLTAYPSVLHELCRYCRRQGISLEDLGLRLLHCQSEMLLDVHRHGFRAVFGEVPVLDEYGCVEVGAMAYTCPAGTRHISHEQVLLEVVDAEGRPCAPGQRGRILLTPLEARGMPLLRYDVGDDGVLSSEAPADACPCGRGAGLAQLASLEGRSFERILTRDGRAFSAGLVHFLVRRAGAVAGLGEYLAVQEEPGRLRLLVIPSEAWEEALAGRILVVGREVFGESLEITVEKVTRIERPPGKKRSYFLSRLPAVSAEAVAEVPREGGRRPGS